MKNRNPPAPKIALALAGGGPLGAIYEIGALCALEEALQGLDFTALELHALLDELSIATRLAPRS